MNSQESNEGSSAIISIHPIYAVGAAEKLVLISICPVIFGSVSLQALNYLWVRTCLPLTKQARCTLHLLKCKLQKPTQEYASVSRMAHTANLNSFHMLPKNCDQMPLIHKWGDCLDSTEKGFIMQLQATAPLFLGLPGLPQCPLLGMLLTGLNAASCQGPVPAALCLQAHK